MAALLVEQGQHAKAEEKLEALLHACQRDFGKAHRETLVTAQCLETVRSGVEMHAEQPSERGGKVAAWRKECAARSSLSPTAIVEAEAQAKAAEADLLAMLELEEAGVQGTSKSNGTRKPKGGKGKRGPIQCPLARPL